MRLNRPQVFEQHVLEGEEGRIKKDKVLEVVRPPGSRGRQGKSNPKVESWCDFKNENTLQQSIMMEAKIFTEMHKNTHVKKTCKEIAT